MPKVWIDSVALTGRTFSYVDGSPVGLLTGKRATICIASGGRYGAGTAMASLNHAEPYLRTIFGFFGVTDVNFISAGGTSTLSRGGDRNAFLEPLVASVRSHFQPA